jgi:hypothetical protein
MKNKLDLSKAEPGRQPSPKTKAQFHISDQSIIVAHYSTWFIQEPGQKDWTRIQNFPFPDGSDNYYKDAVSGLPDNSDFCRTAARIQ